MHRVEGKGLSGFIFGLLFATVAIGGVLYFLNHTPSGIREEARVPVEKTPEVLTPKGAAGRQAGVSSPEPASEPLVAVEREPLEQGDSTSDAANTVPVSEPYRAHNGQERKSVVVETESSEKPRVADVRRRPADSAPSEVEKDVRSGRAAVENAGQPEPRRHAVSETKADNHTAAPPRRQAEEAAVEAPRPSVAAPAARGNNRVVQMGAFGSVRAADAQQAKLALMGIATQVERTVTADGRTVYRVHSGGVSREEARSIGRILDENGVEHITRSVR